MGYYCDECNGFIDKFGWGHKTGCSKIKHLEVVEQTDYISELEAKYTALREAADALAEATHAYERGHSDDCYTETSNRKCICGLEKLEIALAHYQEVRGE